MREGRRSDGLAREGRRGAGRAEGRRNDGNGMCEELRKGLLNGEQEERM